MKKKLDIEKQGELLDVALQELKSHTNTLKELCGNGYVPRSITQRGYMPISAIVWVGIPEKNIPKMYFFVYLSKTRKTELNLHVLKWKIITYTFGANVAERGGKMVISHYKYKNQAPFIFDPKTFYVKLECNFTYFLRLAIDFMCDKLGYLMAEEKERLYEKITKKRKN